MRDKKRREWKIRQFLYVDDVKSIPGSRVKLGALVDERVRTCDRRNLKINVRKNKKTVFLLERMRSCLKSDVAKAKNAV